MLEGYTEFEFDLPNALLHALIDVFDSLTMAPLLPDQLAQIPQEQGVYQLFLVDDGVPRLVYIGKTDAASGLADRLRRHSKKVQHRLNLSPEAVMFKAVRVFVFTAVDLEAQLIEHYDSIAKVQWNHSGFGSNDPGIERDTTKYKSDHFETQFPIDIHRQLDFEVPNPASASKILQILKSKLPYLIRFERLSKGSRVAHPDLEQTVVQLDAAGSATPENIICQVIGNLPPGWHATMLPSHIIIYKNDVRKFPSGKLIARSPETRVQTHNTHQTTAATR